jgi:hypothetical protein
MMQTDSHTGRLYSSTTQHHSQTGTNFVTSTQQGRKFLPECKLTIPLYTVLSSADILPETGLY